MGTADTSPPASETWSYDDSARTATLAMTLELPVVGSISTTSVYTYDANGNIVRAESANGPVVGVVDYTATATKQVCK
jgi:YD repeat-containing protein